MGLLDRLNTDKKPGEDTSKKGPVEDPYKDIKSRIQEGLIDEIDNEVLNMPDQAKKEEIIKSLLNNMIKEAVKAANLPYTTSIHVEIMNDILDEILGLGPIEKLLKDDSVSEVMVNGPYQVYCERKGKLILTDTKFRDNEHVMRVLEKIVAPLGRRIDESSPMVDARLKDGSRVNAIIPPLALNGPTITIRKFAKTPITIEDLIRFGSMTREIAQFLEACVKARLNIVVSGGTGSGKTTLLNVLSSFIPDDERIITVEDAAEIQLRQSHVVSLESRPPNIEGKGAVTIRDLIKNTLRMRPERVIVGECRSGETLDMLQAMNTGHDGSLTTGHANTPRDMLKRIETMVMMAGMDLPIKAIREQIASAVHMIVQQSRLEDGSRKVMNVTEIQGMEGDVITLQDIFVFKRFGHDENGKIKGDLVPTGIRPKFMNKFTEHGIKLATDIFTVRN